MAIFVNETRPLVWDFRATPWTATLKGPLPPSGAIGFFVLTGPDLPCVRKMYMELVGHSPVPPRSVFWPWIMQDQNPEPPEASAAFAELSGLRGRFPEFGGVGVVWSDPEADLPWSAAKDAGVELLSIESPYVPVSSTWHAELSRRGFLVKSHAKDGGPMQLKYNGVDSGLLDYTDSGAGSSWHDLFRRKRVEAGARIFYLTGGEPEVYSPSLWYRGSSDPDSHSHYAWANRYSLKWMESIRNMLQHTERSIAGRAGTFILSRSGAGGMGRFKAGVFTVDTNLAFFQMASQARAHLNLSGIDYYTTDVTPNMGFSFMSLTNAEPLYEAWFARNAFLNLPLMVPDSFARLPWARQALYEKAKLDPYYYSLAHRAAIDGEPINSPLMYYFQDDPKARSRAFETMLGPHLLIGANIRPGSEMVWVYLPKGNWWSLFDEELIMSEGELKRLPSKRGGMHLAPVLVREGAIVPTLSQPEDPNSLPLVIFFPGPGESCFLWYEDNKQPGINLPGDEQAEDKQAGGEQPEDKQPGDNQAGDKQADDKQAGDTQPCGKRASPGNLVTWTEFTLSSTKESGGLLKLRITSSIKDPPKGQTHRAYMFQFVGVGNIRKATLDDQLYDRVTSVNELARLESGWVHSKSGILYFKTPPLPLTGGHVIEVE
jgi:alpha-glucosidase